jgi:hypothetical protein
MLHLATPDRPDHSSEEEKSSRIEALDARRTKDHLETDIRGASPFSTTELVEVTFNDTANADTVIRHTLNSTQPDRVLWQVVGVALMAAPATVPVIYRDSSTNHRKWESDYIILRSNVAGLKATLVLGVPRE